MKNRIPDMNQQALLIALINLYADYASYYPSAVTNSPAMKAAAEILHQCLDTPADDIFGHQPAEDIGQMITDYTEGTGIDYSTALVHLNID